MISLFKYLKSKNNEQLHNNLFELNETNTKVDENPELKRGDIYLVDLGQGLDSEQQGIRPCLVIQNDIGNRYSKTTIVAAISSRLKDLPTHYTIDSDFDSFGLDEPSQILFEQIRTISKKRITSLKRIGHIDLNLVKEPLLKSFGFSM